MEYFFHHKESHGRHHCAHGPESNQSIDKFHDLAKGNYQNDTMSGKALFSPPVYYFFISAEFIAIAGILLVLATVIFSKAVVRGTVWVNFLFSWMLFATSFLLPLLQTPADSSDHTSYTLCFISATLRFAVQPLCACSTLALTIETWCAVTWPNDGPQRRTMWLLLVPYIVYLSFLIGGALDQDGFEASPGTNKKMCFISSDASTKLSLACVITAILFSFIFQTLVIVLLMKQHFRIDEKDVAEGASRGVNTALRMGAFSLITIMLFAVTAVHMTNHSKHKDGTDRNHDQDNQGHPKQFHFAIVIAALLPLTVMLIFGTKMDILEALLFWRRRKPRPTSGDDRRWKPLPDLPAEARVGEKGPQDVADQA